MTFAFPVLFLINVCFLIYWTLNINVKLILSLFILICFFYNSSDFYKIRDNTIEKKEGFHVMSFNVRLFNNYSWIENDSIAHEIKNFFETENPDVLSIQEYHESYKGLLNQYKYSHSHLYGNKVGQSIHTNNKIIKKGIVEFENSQNNAIYVDLLEERDTIRVYNAHFESYKVDVQKIKADIVTFKSIISKIKSAYLIQKKQSKILINHIKNSPHKTILTIDLNNTEHSFIYKEIANELNDVFDLIGHGYGSTYNLNFLPFRIDYIFISESILPNYFKVYNNKLSDHKPISSFLNI